MKNNIISNDCVGGYIYRDWLKLDNLNPFIWSSIDLDNFCKVIASYNKIDFSNIKCELVFNDSGICKQGSMVPKITIDNDIEVYFFHYMYDTNFLSPTKRSGYTMCENIISYTVDSYARRVKRMTEEPVFVWDVTKIKWYNKTSKDPLDVFKKIKTDYNIIIYQPDTIDFQNGNIVVLNKTNAGFEVNVSAKNIYNKFLKDGHIK